MANAVAESAISGGISDAKQTAEAEDPFGAFSAPKPAGSPEVTAELDT